MSIAGLEDYLNREFGELDEGTLPRQAGRRADRLLDQAPSSAPDAGLSSGIPEWTPPSEVAASGKSSMGDVAKQFGAGVVDVGSQVVGGAEYLARQNKYTRGTGVQDALTTGRKAVEGWSQDISNSVSAAALDEMGREWLSTDPSKTIWQGGPGEFAMSVLLKTSRTLPSSLATLAPAAIWFRGMQSAKALSYLGASEAGLTMGGVANGIANEIEQAPHEELLAGSQRYRQLYEQLDDEAAARDQLITEAQGASPAAAAAFVAAVSLTAGRYLEPVFLKTGAGGGLGAGSRVGRGFLAEAAQEGPQSAAEQLATNLSARLYDENRNLSEGVAESAVEGAVLGGLIGGGFSGAFGQRPDRPTPPPTEDEGGQLNLPGFGPQQGIPTAEDPDPVDPMERPFTGMGGDVVQPGPVEQGDLFDNGPMSDPSMRPIAAVPGEPGQMDLPLTRRERGQRNAPIPPTETIPDELDQPTAEPQADLEAQLADMKKASGRSAVYVSPEQKFIPQIPKGAVEIRNFDGKGGTLIAKNQAAATHARNLRAKGGSMQAIIGELTMAGVGKPNVRAGYAVQLLDQDGAVARESLVATKKEANALEKEWAADGSTRVLSGPEALARRGEQIEREQTDLRTEDPALVDEAMPDMFAQGQAPTLTAAENQSKAGAFQVQMTDDDGNEIVTETFDTVEEADARTDELAADFPDGIITSKQLRVAAEPTKAGISTTKRVPKKVLKGPPEGPPRDLPKKDVSTEPTRPKEVSIEPEEFDESISVKDIEALPTFFAEYSVITEVPQANKTITPVETRESREFKTRGAAQSYATRMTNKAQAIAGPDMKVKPGKVSAASSPELEAAFASAAQAKADRKQGTADEEAGKKVGGFATEGEARFEGPEGVADTGKTRVEQYKNENKAPSQKVQFIRRERAAQLQRKNPIKNVGAAPTTTVARGGKTQETVTKPLTYQKEDGERTVEQEIKLKKVVKEANTRLRFALNRAKKFMDRFDTTGEYGTYVADNTNVDGTLTQTAKDFLAARAALVEMVEFANSALASGNVSNAHAAMARKIAITLERIKLQKMNPEQFAKEFSAVARKEDRKMLKRVPARFKESPSQRDSKVNKLNAERSRANERQERLEETWGKDKVWTENIGPIFRKFADAMLANIANPASNTYYNPTLTEIGAVRYALRTFRKMSERYPASEYYDPIKEQLEYYGFEFDRSGDVIVQEFSPSENLLAAGFQAKHGVSKKAADEVVGAPSREAVVEVQDSAQLREDRDRSDKVKAVSGINTANALLDKFKKMVSPSKTTITGLKRQEQRFVRGLRKLGVWTDTAPGMGKISFGGYSSRTYRLIGPRLDNRTISKGEAKGAIDRLKRFVMPRELAGLARKQQNTAAQGTIEAFVDSNSTEFFLEEINLPENEPAIDNAASAVGDLIRDKYSQADANTVLDLLIEQLPEGHFYQLLAKRLRQLDMSDMTLQYDWAGVKFDGLSSALGKFDPNQGRAYLNRDVLGSVTGLRGTRSVHTMLHEFLHGATHHALANNPELRQEMFDLRAQAIREWRKVNGPNNAQYGLDPSKPLDEFVVEVFANEEIQDHLRSSQYTPAESGMRRFINMILKHLGLPQIDSSVNMFDAFMQNEDALFEGAGNLAEGAEVLNYELYDSVLREPAKAIWDKVNQHSNIVQRVKDAGGTALRNIQSMEQFVENYAKDFIVEGKSLLQQYHDAFSARNAKASEYMDLPQRISRAWTKLEESDPDAALEVSRIGTEASINRVAAAEAPEGDNAVHASLHNRYNALSEEAKKVYNAAKNYYREAANREHLFLLQSALRGVMTNKQGVGLDIDTFEAKFNVTELGKIESRDDLSNMIGEYIPDEARSEMIDQLYRMSVIPRQQTGDYFPAMRYGDEVVYAEKMSEERILRIAKKHGGFAKR